MPMHSIYFDSQLLYRHVTDETPNNDQFYMHIHEQCEILYFVSGAATYTVETTTRPIVPDTLVLMRPMESHCITILAKEPYERFTLNFSDDLINSVDPEHKLLAPFYDRPLGERNFYRADEFFIPPARILSAMQIKGQRNTDRLSVMTYFHALLGEINRAFDRKKNDPNPEQTKSLAAEASDYINAHLFDNISVQMVADKLFVSVSQLNRRFKKATGFSPWEYIIGKRLATARNLIKSGVPATHAYVQCGFNDYSSFYRLYMKRFGISPKSDSVKSD